MESIDSSGFQSLGVGESKVLFELHSEGPNDQALLIQI